MTVRLDGGELTVDVSDELELTQSGTASRVYAGELDAGFVRQLGEL